MKKRNILVTAGNTRVPIDKVRSIGNIFSGRTGASIAEYFAQQGHRVEILTSGPDLVKPCGGLLMWTYKTYDDLFGRMERLIRPGCFDIIIHSAAVSDYKVEGMYRQADVMQGPGGRKYLDMAKLDSSGKIGSDHHVLWMKMVPTMKIVDQIRNPWGFKGVLVKFKLQVGMQDKELIEVATRSMNHSGADIIVANTLEGMTSKAFIISAKGGDPICTSRDDLPANLYKELEL